MSDNPFLRHVPEPPLPPHVLYKFVAPERVDVLESCHIRFTPFHTTNDDFEVRRTFKFPVGPKMTGAIFHELDRIDLDAMLNIKISEIILENGIDVSLKPLLKESMSQHFGGPDFKSGFRLTLQNLWKLVVPMINHDARSDQMMQNLFGDLLILSLTETPHNSAMWAHYALDRTGFVIAFNTDSPFFATSVGARKRLQKIIYFDGELDEIMDDYRKALFSKVSDWSYEREWRSFAKGADADRTIETEGQQIHLFAFPPETVCGVYVRCETPATTVQRICAALGHHCPGAFLRRLEPNREKGTYDEVDL